MTNRDTDIPSESILAEIEQLLVSEGSPEHTLAKVGDGLRQLVPHDTLTIYTADTIHRLLRPTLVRDHYAEELMAMGSIPFGAGITGAVAETAQPALDALSMNSAYQAWP